MAILHSLAIITLAVVIYYFAIALKYEDGKSSVEIEDMPKEMKLWHEMGHTVTINGHEMFYIYQECRSKNVENPPTFALVHGFPSSSFDYHKVIDELLNYGNVFANDHIGFGFSDIPLENFTFSLSEAAENLLAVWRHAKVRKAHVISHDMGDSVITEILARRERKMMPSYFDEFFESVTFTNGGMRYEMINFRIAQLISMYPFPAKLLSEFASKIGILETVFKKQILSVWSPFVQNTTERDRDIHNLYIINAYKDKVKYGYKLGYYLWDRYHFEFRWFDALRNLNIPCRFIWSDSDSVSPLAIPESFKSMVPNYKLSVVKQSGHFWMLENPARWVQEVLIVLK